MTPKEILVSARKLIEKPENWTQEYFARNREGHDVESTNCNAVCWCAIGALQKCAGIVDFYKKDSSNEDFNAYMAAKDILGKAIYRLESSIDFPHHVSVPFYNDEHTHEQVLELYDKAITLAE